MDVPVWECYYFTGKIILLIQEVKKEVIDTRSLDTGHKTEIRKPPATHGATLPSALRPLLTLNLVGD